LDPNGKPHPRVIDITGQQFGRLTVLEQAASRPGGEARWRCRCQCGNELVAFSYYLRNGLTTSCGCRQTEVTRDLSATHGQSGLPEFNAWRGIQRRCNDPKSKGYPTHGGRGIRCLWASLDELIADVGERPSPEHRLVRLDPDGHFEAGNCSWMTRAEQAKLHSNYTRHKR
jgi:hypothetical protein